jgi:putative nucleotidyltransferase with HDIG domain
MSEQGWQGRPRWAAVVRVVILLVPLVAGIAGAIVMAHLVARPRELGPALLWWLANFAVSTLVMTVVAHQARRLLPLAALLKLSMAFPDKTPSRFAVALRAGTVGNLKMRLADVRENGIDNEVGAAAETILVLSAAMNAHDRQTRGHAERVRAFTEMLAEELGLDLESREKLRWASLLHDVGKVMVAPEILNKTGALDEHEWAAIHRHPDDGARIAAPLAGWLGEWSLAIEQHHERWDGTGYPRHLAGEDISWAARIVAVADAFEVMTAVRSYKPALGPGEARKELAAAAGSHFDPTVVRAFLGLSIGRMRWVMGPLAWIAQAPLVRAIGAAGSSVTVVAGGAAAVVSGAALGLLPAAPPSGTAPRPAHIQALGATTSTTLAAPGIVAPVTAPAPTAAPVTTAPPPVVTTTRPNRSPIAADDSAETQSKPSKPVKIVLTANDVDPDGDTLTVRILEAPTKGRANASDGSVNYVPDNEAVGPDVFTYEACDPRGACDAATVTVHF